MLVDRFNTQGIINHTTVVRKDLAKATEKLSTGYTINRAADNPANLAVSEKMRSLIRGLAMAAHNSEDGISLIKVGEGALQEVHDMLSRIREMAVQSSNATYTSEDRQGLQSELKAIVSEVDRIAKSTHFNGIHLFQDSGIEAEVDLSGWDMGDYKKIYKAINSNIYLVSDDKIPETDTEASTDLIHRIDTDESFSIDELSDHTDSDKVNIIYAEVRYDFTTTQTGSGNSIDASAVTAKGVDACNSLANTLKSQIVPNVVEKLLSRYGDAFSYLRGSSIGIGLNLYNDPSSNTLAYVQVGVNGTTDSLKSTYTLAVNTAHLDFTGSELSGDSRKALERTISHEMVHAFMDEAATAGMLGISATGGSGGKFPMWFTEGMAQTASGPGNWVRSSNGLGLGTSASDTQITAALQSKPLASSGSDTAVQYGTGYLACMYLGYAVYNKYGQHVNMSNPTQAADAIAKGAGRFLQKIISGSSLDDAIKKYTKFDSVEDFQNKFATDRDVIDFVRSLLPYCSDGYGGIISGNLMNNDPVPDIDRNVALFELDTAHSAVQNAYPSEVNVISGGLSNAEGKPPTADYKAPSEGGFGENEGGIILQIGARTGNIAVIPQFYFSADALGMDNLDVSTRAGANDSIELVDIMIERVSTIRSKYGAVQNELEHSLNSINTAHENLQSAESQIRDTDMASMYMNYVLKSIVTQSGMAMLSQANDGLKQMLNLLGI